MSNTIFGTQVTINENNKLGFYINQMFTIKPIQSIREVHEKLTGQTGSQKRIYKEKYTSILLDSSEVTTIAKFLQKHEKELKIIYEERKVLALMNNHEDVESYNSKLSPQIEKIVFFYKIFQSYISKIIRKEDKNSFWILLGNYIQDMKSSDDRYYASKLPYMVQTLRKGMVNTYENECKTLKKPYLETILQGVYFDYDKIKHAFWSLREMTEITSVQTYLSEQISEVITGLKAKIIEENINLKKLLKIPVDKCSNQSLNVLFENLSKLKMKYEQSTKGWFSCISSKQKNSESQRLSEIAYDLLQKQNKLKELEHIFKQKSNSLDESNKLVEQLKERLNNDLIQKEEMKNLETKNNRKIQKLERFKTNIQSYLSINTNSQDEIYEAIKFKLQSLKHYEQFKKSLSLYFSASQDSLNKLEETIKRKYREIQNETDKYSQKIDELVHLEKSSVITPLTVVGKLNKLQNFINDLSYKSILAQNSTVVLQKHEEQFIKHKIEDYLKKKIIGCELLYKLDKLNQTRHKEYLARKSNNLILIRTSSDQIIAGFSSIAYSEDKGNEEKKGLLMYVNQQKIFPLKNGASPVTSDPRYIAFGNWEILVEKGVKKMQIHNVEEPSYQMKEKLNVTLQTKEGQVPIISYEIYGVEFEESSVKKHHKKATEETECDKSHLFIDAEKVEEENQKLSGEVQKLMAVIKEKQQNEGKLRKQIEDYVRKLNKFEEENKKHFQEKIVLQQQNQKLKSDLESKQKQNSEQKKAKADLDSRISFLSSSQNEKQTELQRKVEQLSQENTRLNGLIEQEEKEKKRNELINEGVKKQFEKKINQSSEKSEGLAKEIQVFLKENEQMKIKNKSLSQQIEKFTEEKKKLSKEISQLETKKEELTRNSGNLGTTIENLQKENQELREGSEKLKSEKASLENNYKEIKEKHEKLAQKNDGLIKKHENLQKDHQKLRKELGEERKNSQSLKQANKKQSQSIQTLKSEKEKMHQQFTKQNENHQKTMKIKEEINKQKQMLEEKLKNKQKELSEQNSKFQQIIKEGEQKYITLQGELSSSLEQQKAIFRLKEQLEVSNNKLKDQLSKCSGLNPYKHLFIGDALEDKEKEKQFLIKEIEKFNQNKKITKTKFLYNYPTFAQNKFHDHIDGKPHFVIIIRLENDMIVAGYSQQALKEDVENNSQGFIASLTNQEIFLLKRTQRTVVTYNPYFIIFGNAQIRIKEKTNFMESNFGITHRHFSTTYKTPDVLLGKTEEERKANIKCYDIIQVFFEE